MGRNGKRISSIKKIEAVEKYNRGEGSQESIARKYGVTKASFQQWIVKYETMGMSGLVITNTNNRYNTELKTAAVEAYLRGEGSQLDVCKKFNILSKTQLQNWVTLYNNGHKDFRATKGRERRINMTEKGRSTTLNERIEIVSYCIANDKDYALTIEEFGVSYQQIYSWVRKYEENGVDGLIDRRGKRRSIEEMSEVERLQAENKMLKAENKRKEMEIAVLKKVQEIERRRY
ncbi:transposase [Marinicrinis lubricantis]|uniref:Transposase n=1 Tax=Marinicrinis lubricantis TaxID=2086470 RepID=A0ABW1ING5_9BACL